MNKNVILEDIWTEPLWQFAGGLMLLLVLLLGQGLKLTERVGVT